jgi:hypothetical protein
MKPALFNVLFFFGLVSSTVHAQSGQLLPTDLFTGVIFSAEDYDSSDMLQTLGYAVGEDVVGVWTPTNEDVLLLETTFIIYLNESEGARANEVLTRLHEYKRQYLGVELKDRRLIFATFGACTEISNEELVEEFIPFLPLDGGTCFTELLFDPVAKSFYRVYIHGEA